MTIDVLLMIFGGVLVFVAIIGGGFEVKEVHIPRIGAMPRAAAAVVGTIAIFMGIGVHTPADAPKPGASTMPVQAAALTPEAPPQPVKFYVSDHLGESQVSEQVTLVLDGEKMGDVTINAHYPNSQITLKAAPGRHSYLAAANAVFLENDMQVEHTGVGQGYIDVKEGETFELEGSQSGDVWLVSLVEAAR